MTLDKSAIVGVVGAGTMGVGIAQVASAAGHRVLVFDSLPGAAEQAKTRIADGLDGLVAKGRLEKATRDAITNRIEPVSTLEALAPCKLLVEAIVEDLGAKRELFGRLEAICAAETVLASNTSSISITAIARDLKHQGRLAGLHFFNPAPIMKLVEIVRGLATTRETAETLFELAQSWNKAPVHARSTPGFIVNRIARPFYAEALALLLERRTTPAVIDACIRGAGFRMGPCALMDLIGHDVNFAVTQSVFEANFGDKRFVPSLVQRELVDGGMLGRKTGRGFYPYGKDTALPEAASEPRASVDPSEITILGAGAVADRLAAALKHAKRTTTGDPGLVVGATQLWLTDGRTAATRARANDTPQAGVFDFPLNSDTGALAVAFAPQCTADMRAHAKDALAAAGFVPYEIGDAPGLIVARTVAMLVNEAADAVQQGVCSAQDADTAMKLGVNYPAGPFEWLDQLGAPYVIGVLNALADVTRSERYRASPYLAERI